MAADTRNSADAAMDAAGLYREEIVTDRKIGTIRMLVPVKSDGSADDARKTDLLRRGADHDQHGRAAGDASTSTPTTWPTPSRSTATPHGPASSAR